jgi:thymidylate synthase
MSNVEQQYLDLVKDILENGYTKMDRTKTGTKSVFGRTIRHSMKDGFPLLTTKKMAWKTMVTELLWFLRGDTNIKYLVDNGCHIWVGDAYKNYEKHCQSLGITEYDDKETFIKGIKELKTYADKFGELGPVYGKQWRRWEKYGFRGVQDGAADLGWETESPYIDQIANAIHLLKTDPDSRRNLVNAYNVGELDQMVLPPCHYSFQFYTRELSLDERAKQHPNPNMFYDIHGSFNIGDSIENSDMTIEDREWLHGKFNDGNIPKRAISLLWNQRSCDLPLGLPINIPSYSLLLMMTAKQVNMVPEEVIGNLGDCHIYLNQIEGIKEQLSRTPYELPIVKISDRQVNDISEYTIEDFTLEKYQCHPKIKMPLSN